MKLRMDYDKITLAVRLLNLAKKFQKIISLNDILIIL
jgi:hypothetical protein